MRTLIIITALLCYPLSVTAQDSTSLDPADWRARFSQGVRVKGPGWFFNFPDPPGHVNYVTTPYRGELEGRAVKMAIAIQIISGAPRFVPLDRSGCSTLAFVRPYFDTGDMYDQFGRWWSHQTAIELQAGVSEITVPLTSDHWSSVYGRFANRPFRRAMRNIRNIGFTFGGCFFGHGVNVRRGEARFLLMQYQVEPSS